MPAITDVAGLLVGHAQDFAALTGVTVVLTPEGAVGGVDVRGGAPGTRETDLLRPENTVQQVHAVTLTGGSAMGLAAATGVVQWLRERGYGFDVGLTRVPIVPAAVIFDLTLGSHEVFPDGAMGYAACVAAGSEVPEGSVGAGTGASCGKLLGPGQATKTGIGTWSETLADGTTIGALVVVNAWGDVWREHGGIIAGVRAPAGGFADATALLREPQLIAALAGRQPAEGRNTTLAVVATDAVLTKAQATKLAQMAHDGLARTLRPVHTPLDGDTVFALATGRRQAPPMAVLGAVAAEVLARAVERAALEAQGLGGLPAARDLVEG